MPIKIKKFHEIIYDRENYAYGLLSSVKESEKFADSIEYTVETFTTEKPRKQSFLTGMCSIEPQTKLGQLVRSVGGYLEGFTVTPEMVEDCINSLEGQIVRFKYLPTNPRKPGDYKWNIDHSTIQIVFDLPSSVKEKLPASILGQLEDKLQEGEKVA